MRFKKAQPPLHGDKRTLKRFAWLPIRFSRFILWLEFYQQKQVFVDERDGMFSTYKWVNTEKIVNGK
jgi:hypothetical protein